MTNEIPLKLVSGQFLFEYKNGKSEDIKCDLDFQIKDLGKYLEHKLLVLSGAELDISEAWKTYSTNRPRTICIYGTCGYFKFQVREVV